MFSARKAVAMADGYLPDMRMIYEHIMNETRDILTNLERRFQTFSQQQFIFVTALDRCRKIAFEPTLKIANIAQIYNFVEHVADNATDKRIFNIFLSLVRDLGEFRRTLTKLAKQKNDEKLNQNFSKWKRILESRQDISNLRARFPYCHVNHLSCDEARNHFGGVVSVLPVAMECARDAVERIEIIRAYRPNTTVKDSCNGTSRHNRRPRTARSYKEKEIQTASPPVCQPVQPPSPAISSPLSTNTPSEVTLHSASSEMMLPLATKCKKSLRPASVVGTYGRQAQTTNGNAKSGRVRVQRPRSGIATQTPNYLGSTLKPALDWPHQTISEAEMRKLLKQRKQAVVRPEWKP